MHCKAQLIILAILAKVIKRKSKKVPKNYVFLPCDT